MLGVGTAVHEFFTPVVLLVAVGFFEGEPRCRARGGKRQGAAGGPGGLAPPRCGLAWLWHAIVVNRITRSHACTVQRNALTLLPGGVWLEAFGGLVAEPGSPPWTARHPRLHQVELGCVQLVLVLPKRSERVQAQEDEGRCWAGI